MSKLFFVPLLAFANLALASTPSLEPDTSFEINIKDDKREKDPYFKVGASLISLDLGVGFRKFNPESTKAFDQSLNIHSTPFGLSTGGVVTYKYSIINYNKDSVFKKNKYTGVGLELGAYLPGWKSVGIPIPNVELIFGREYDNGNGVKWGQLGINLLPIGFGVALLTDKNAGGYAPLLFAISAMSAVSYTVAF